jgi:hypothetical protein
MTLELIPENLPGLPCKGSAITQILRDARARESTTRTRVRIEAIKSHAIAARHDMGATAKILPDLLDDPSLENIPAGWFSQKAKWITEDIQQAMIHYCDDDLILSDGEILTGEDITPTKPTWQNLRALADAMFEHAESLKDLQITEKIALRNP